MGIADDENTVAISSVLSTLPADRRIKVFLALAHEITVCARASYPGQVGPEEVVNSLVTYNELQHSITGQLRGLLENEEKIYPTDVFVSILFDKAREGKCEDKLVYAFKRVLDWQ